MGVGIALSMYSMYMPFAQDLGDVKFYNSSYYAALSSIERGSLALRYHQPGYEWKSPLSDVLSGSFGMLSKQGSSMTRIITSKVTSIPITGQGNVDPLFSAQSSNYNKIGYYQKEKFFLWYDNTTSTGSAAVYLSSPAATKANTTGQHIDISIRLNPIAYAGFNKVIWEAILQENVDIDGDSVRDDTLVDWSWKGTYGSVPWYSFTIMPREHILYNSSVIANTDTLIRESVVNAVTTGVGNNVVFDTYNPIREPNNKVDTTWLNIIAERDDLSGHMFNQLLSDWAISDQSLSLSLINKLQAPWGIYPFLEYRLTAGGGVIPDRYYTLEGIGKVGNYEVRMLLRKPTSEENIAADFTIIF